MGSICSGFRAPPNHSLCDPFARNHALRFARRVGDERARFAGCLFELLQLCVHIGAMSRRATHQLVSSRWRSDSIALRRENGHQTWECKGEKGISCQPKAVWLPVRRNLSADKSAHNQAGPHRPAFVFVAILAQSCKSKATQFCQGWLFADSPNNPHTPASKESHASLESFLASSRSG
jgi:hypothetical protein